MTQDSKRTRLMKSFLSEDLPEFPKLDNSSKISLTEKNPTPESTPMKLLPTELQFKEELSAETLLKKLKV